MSSKSLLFCFILSFANLEVSCENSELCNLCIDVISSIESYLQDGHTHDQIMAVVEEVKIHLVNNLKFICFHFRFVNQSHLVMNGS